MADYKSTHPSEKDPDRPKKPLTAYMLFTNSKRAEIKQAHPGRILANTSIYRLFDH